MITFWGHGSPNPHKVAIALEELGLPYEARVVDTPAGEQQEPWFTAMSTNAKGPVIHDAGTGRTVYESNAILLSLADKAGRLIPPIGDPGRDEALQLLFLQASAVGPMFGQRAWVHPLRAREAALRRRTPCARGQPAGGDAGPAARWARPLPRFRLLGRRHRLLRLALVRRASGLWDRRCPTPLRLVRSRRRSAGGREGHYGAPAVAGLRTLPGIAAARPRSLPRADDASGGGQGSGGLTRLLAGGSLAASRRMIARFACALTEGLRPSETHEEFGANPGSAAKKVCEASVDKV